MTTVEIFEKVPVGATIRDKIEAYSMADPNSGCWLWIGYVNAGGYGVVSVPNKTPGLAHRASYEEYVGHIPEGMMALHRCDTPCCVNPKHLFLGTQTDNMVDMVNKGRNRDTTGILHPRCKLSERQVLAIDADIKSGKMVYRQIAEKHQISVSVVSKIKTGMAWAHVTKEIHWEQKMANANARDERKMG